MLSMPYIRRSQGSTPEEITTPLPRLSLHSGPYLVISALSYVRKHSMPTREQCPDVGISKDPDLVSGGISKFSMS
jgi:hypothetical protein